MALGDGLRSALGQQPVVTDAVAPPDADTPPASSLSPSDDGDGDDGAMSANDGCQGKALVTGDTCCGSGFFYCRIGRWYRLEQSHENDQTRIAPF